MAASTPSGSSRSPSFAPGLLNVGVPRGASRCPGPPRRERARPGPRAGHRRARRRRAQVVAQWPRCAAIGFLRQAGARLRRPGRARHVPADRADDLRHRRLLHRPHPLAALPVRARRGRAELLLVGDAPVRVPAGHLRHGALDRGAPRRSSTLAAKGEIGELSKTYAHGMRLSRCSSPSRRASRSSRSASRSWSPSSSAARSTPPRLTRPRARSSGRGGRSGRSRPCARSCPSFYALGDTRTPVIVSALDLTAFIALAVGLEGRSGTSASASRSPARAWCRWLLLFAGLARKLDDDSRRRDPGLGRRARSSPRSSPEWAPGARRVWPPACSGRGFPASPGARPSSSVFLASAWGARAPELEMMLAGLLRRLGRRARAS